MTTLLVPVKPAKECNCEFDREPEIHDWLLGIEDMSAVAAAMMIAELIGNDGSSGPTVDITFFATGGEPWGEWPIFRDCHDFGRFVASHNWRDPAAMAALADAVDFAAEQSQRGRWQRQHAVATTEEVKA